jgi:hypothetical protein
VVALTQEVSPDVAPVDDAEPVTDADPSAAATSGGDDELASFRL